MFYGRDRPYLHGGSGTKGKIHRTYGLWDEHWTDWGLYANHTIVKYWHIMCKMGNLWGKDQRGSVKVSSKRIREKGQESHGNHIEGIKYDMEGIWGSQGTRKINERK